MVANTAKKLFCISIIIIVFSVTLGTTFIIIKKGITSDTSNYNLAKNLVRTYYPDDYSIASADSSHNAKKISCRTFVSNSVNDSVVDFLNANNIDSSFNSRLIFASEAGIENYMGLYEENGVLLKYLISKYSIQNDCLNAN